MHHFLCLSVLLIPASAFATANCADLAKVDPKAYAESASKSYLSLLSSTPEVKSVLTANQGFAASYIKEAKALCDSVTKQSVLKSGLAADLDKAVSESGNSQCKAYGNLANALVSAQKNLKPVISKLRAFLRQTPYKAAQAEKKNSQYLVQLGQKNPGTVDPTQLRNESKKFFYGKIPGYSDGQGLNVYQVLVAQRKEACDALEKMSESETTVRMRDYSCRGAVLTTTVTNTDISTGTTVPLPDEYNPDRFIYSPSTVSTSTSVAISTDGRVNWSSDPMGYQFLCGVIY